MIKMNKYRTSRKKRYITNKQPKKPLVHGKTINLSDFCSGGALDKSRVGSIVRNIGLSGNQETFSLLLAV